MCVCDHELPDRGDTSQMWATTKMLMEQLTRYLKRPCRRESARQCDLSVEIFLHQIHATRRVVVILSYGVGPASVGNTASQLFRGPAWKQAALKILGSKQQALRPPTGGVAQTATALRTDGLREHSRYIRNTSFCNHDDNGVPFVLFDIELVAFGVVDTIVPDTW